MDWVGLGWLGCRNLGKLMMGICWETIIVMVDGICCARRASGGSGAGGWLACMEYHIKVCGL